MRSLVFTCAPASGAYGFQELAALDPAARRNGWLEPGVGLVSLGLDWRALQARLQARQPIWIRHLHPVQAQAPLHGDGRDLPALEAVLGTILLNLDTEQPFSVQTRLLSPDVRRLYSRFDVNERLAGVVASWGAPLDVRAPVQVLSVTCTPGTAYLGFSLAAENLSDWAGGERRFKRDPDQISRAEFKLLEALEAFRIDLPVPGRALDLGAAPGGWARVLASRGMEVVAVDPAELDPRAAALPGVRHIRLTIQEAGLSGLFDLIANDMRMDAVESAKRMVSLARLLKPGGPAVITLKLPENGAERAAGAALAVLEQAYEIRGARQLFHNRSEISAGLVRRAG